MIRGSLGTQRQLLPMVQQLGKSSHWLGHCSGSRPGQSAAAGKRRLLAQRGMARHCNLARAARTTGRRSGGGILAGSRATSGPLHSPPRRLRRTMAASRRNHARLNSCCDIVVCTKLLWPPCSTVFGGVATQPAGSGEGLFSASFWR